MKLRIATFNLENLDETDSSPSLDTRIEILKPQLERLNADIICFQEIHGQEREGEARDIHALRLLLKDTRYEDYQVHVTKISDGVNVYNLRNLVTISKYPFTSANPQQVHHSLVNQIEYNYMTDTGPNADRTKKVKWERPILYSQVDFNDETLHILNVHLKSRLASNVEGQKINQYEWKTNSGWAEGYFVSSMKRVGQALELRMLIDSIFATDDKAKIAVCGDFNAPPLEVPVEVICGKVANSGNPNLNKFEMIACENTIPESSRYTYIHQGQKRLLDHILISKSLLPHYTNSEIHNEILRDESVAFAFDTKFPESDHAPFIIELNMPTEVV